ncbi:MAG TPA: cell division protein ZipA [Chiayiivirga sp.]|nr:cell division protein ZipA [Chiayiivirga sp.]
MNWNPDIGIPLAIAGVLILVAIAIFGRPRKPDQGRRVEPGRASRAGNDERREPRWGSEESGANDDGVDESGERQFNFDAALDPQSEDEVATPGSGTVARGKRNGDAPQRIISLFVNARDEGMIDGAAIVVAAEKAGLVYGDMGIFHRLVDGRPDAEPIFSVANLVKPGHFDLRHVHDIETPGLAFFMTLPGPVSALDAWETMLPTAQRMAELLDAVVLDEEHNALGRQRIAHIRDDLRSFDRAQEKENQRRW